MLLKYSHAGLVIVTLTAAAVAASFGDEWSLSAYSADNRIIMHARNRALKSFLLNHVDRDSEMHHRRGRETVVYDVSFNGNTLSVVDTPEFQAGNGREFLLQLDEVAKLATSGVNSVYFVVAHNDSDSRIQANMNALKMLYGEAMAAKIKLVIESDNDERGPQRSEVVKISPYNHCLYIAPESNHVFPFLIDIYESSRDRT
ncbi:hypothetical protein BVRB_031820 [Beta vulgaris subsp. vulgaris]|uniref:Uncharacterized protein n=1 Tax=Beta vulgaris subsp. vulgaris TaxID=3555 RepID=A0A0J8AX36_BETVV|nr:hypothetical protein BVRB_031820 [Beta vulgaris subsp. vulgaris]